MPGSSRKDIAKGTWVITGGAGYLGRGLLLKLQQLGASVVGIDNYSTSHRLAKAPVLEADLCQEETARKVWQQIPRPIRGVFHFAAKALVGESQEQPDVYFENNVLASIHIARLCASETTPPILVHSSSCAVYGIPSQLPITEHAGLLPISPYGSSKMMCEEIFFHMSHLKGLRTLNLRYFNPVGALDDATHGESHDPETHLIPLAVRAALEGTPMQILGDDYDTPDGSCLRDYIHLEDLLEAHLKAAHYLGEQPGGFCDAMNLGAGRASSVKEVIRTVEAVTRKPIRIQPAPRRPGDPPRLEASIAKAKQALDWKPTRTLEQAIDSHVQWVLRK